MTTPTLAAMTEFHRARIIALDNWTTVQTVMASPSDRVAAIAQALGVTDLGALSILAVAGGPPPERRLLESQLSSFAYLRGLIDNHR